MAVLEAQLDRVLPWLLVLTRLSGLFIAAPILSGLNVPMRAKALASFIAAAAIFPMIEPAFVLPNLTLWAIAPLLAAELSVGVVIGVLAGLPIAALQAGGSVMSYQMGLSIASVYNPELDTQSDLLGELMYMIAMGIFMLVGGLDVLLIALLDSFATVPIGSAGMITSGPPTDVYLAVLASGFEVALRVSAPVTATGLLLLLAMGFVMKTMPQINILTVGFALKIIVGIAAVIAGLLVISDAGHGHVVDSLDSLLGWAESLALSTEVSSGQ